jgi:hypothetical protein
MAVSSPEDSRRLPAAALPNVARFSHASAILNTDTPDGRTRARDGQSSFVPRLGFRVPLDWRYPLLPKLRAGRGGLLGKRRQKDGRKKRTSSAELRFTFVLVVVAGMSLVLGSALVGQLREEEWRSAAISGTILLVLVAASLYSVVQRRRN